MIDSFRAWNKIVYRYQFFNLEQLVSQDGEIQWHIIDIEQSTGKLDKKGKEIFENDFYRVVSDDDGSMDYYIVTWIKEWSMFATLNSGEYVDYVDNGISAILDKTMFWTYAIMNSEEEIEIIGSIKQKEHRKKLESYIFFN